MASRTDIGLELETGDGIMKDETTEHVLENIDKIIETVSQQKNAIPEIITDTIFEIAQVMKEKTDVIIEAVPEQTSTEKNGEIAEKIIDKKEGFTITLAETKGRTAETEIDKNVDIVKAIVRDKKSTLLESGFSKIFLYDLDKKDDDKEVLIKIGENKAKNYEISETGLKRIDMTSEAVTEEKDDLFEAMTKKNVVDRKVKLAEIVTENNKKFVNDMTTKKVDIVETVIEDNKNFVKYMIDKKGEIVETVIKDNKNFVKDMTHKKDNIEGKIKEEKNNLVQDMIHKNEEVVENETEKKGHLVDIAKIVTQITDDLVKDESDENNEIGKSVREKQVNLVEYVINKTGEIMEKATKKKKNLVEVITDKKGVIAETESEDKHDFVEAAIREKKINKLRSAFVKKFSNILENTVQKSNNFVKAAIRRKKIELLKSMVDEKSEDDDDEELSDDEEVVIRKSGGNTVSILKKRGGITVCSVSTKHTFDANDEAKDNNKKDRVFDTLDKNPIIQ